MGVSLNCSYQPFSNRFHCVKAEGIILFLSYSEVSLRGHSMLKLQVLMLNPIFLRGYGKFGNSKLKEPRQSKWTSAEYQDLNSTRLGSVILILQSASYYLTDLKVEL